VAPRRRGQFAPPGLPALPPPGSARSFMSAVDLLMYVRKIRHDHENRRCLEGMDTPIWL